MKTGFKLMFVAICMFLVGCSSPENSFKKAINKNTIEAYKSFIKEYPKSELCKNAKFNINSLAFQEAVKKNTIDGYTKYLDTYHPDSSSVQETNEKICTLKLENAEKENTLEAYVNFVKSCPDSAEAERTKVKIKSLRIKYKAFMTGLTRYGQNERIFDTKLYNIEKKEVIILMYQYDPVKKNNISKIFLCDSSKNNLGFYTIEFDAKGKPVNDKLICFDCKGNLIREFGQPVLIDPVSVTQAMEERSNFVNGYIVESHKKLSPCTDCYEKLKMIDCFFIY